jgi:hypothetical protein
MPPLKEDHLLLAKKYKCVTMGIKGDVIFHKNKG